MKTAVTICLIPEAHAGPFVFRDELAKSFESAAAAGFDAVELFFPSGDYANSDEIWKLAERHRLAIAGVGTGAGMLCHGLSLTDPSAVRRKEALDFLLTMIELGGRLGAPAILGSMQGKFSGETTRGQALHWLAEALKAAGDAAAVHGVPFIHEALNRYETNLINCLADGVELIEGAGLDNVVLLADLFHLNIEEVDVAASIRAAARHIGHVHYADSNRRAMGFGHIDPAPIAGVLREIGYRGYLSAEVLPLPDPMSAARQTIASIREHFP